MEGFKGFVASWPRKISYREVNAGYRHICFIALYNHHFTIMPKSKFQSPINSIVSVHKAHTNQKNSASTQKPSNTNTISTSTVSSASSPSALLALITPSSSHASSPFVGRVSSRFTSTSTTWSVTATI